MVLVTSEACHLCELAKDVLRNLANDYPLAIRTVDLLGREGAALARDSRAPFPPVLFINGDLHGYGRLSSRRLRAHLNDLKASI